MDSIFADDVAEPIHHEEDVEQLTRNVVVNALDPCANLSTTICTPLSDRSSGEWVNAVLADFDSSCQFQLAR